MRTVFFYSSRAIADGVPAAFLGIPHFITERGEPELQMNEYMLARRNGDWAGPQKPGGIYAEIQGQRVLRAKPTYLRTRGYQLDAFRRWCQGHDLRISQATEPLIDQYAEDLEEGLVTEFEGGILPQSVNQHILSIIDFLQFATAQGWRDKVGLTVRTRTTGRKKVEASFSYELMRRANPSEITTWYSEAEIVRFIDEFETAPGKLSAKIMYFTGMRISEVLSLNLSDVPTLEEFQADKAKQWIEVVGKYDKRRRVSFPEQLLRETHRFIGFERRRYTARLIAPTNRLIIGPSTGGASAPMKPRALQKEFQRARQAAKMSILSPHLLRHHYATHFLLKAWRTRQAGRAAALPFEVRIAEPLLAHELILLRQNLGHVSLDTTVQYLYAVGYLYGSDIPDSYAAEISSE